MPKERGPEPLFTGGQLVRLILPLVVEQLLLMTVGMADTVMVTTAGETAVSGVSLVDGINILIIQVFSALSTGGAVVVAQYLGRRDGENAQAAAKQLLYITVGLSLGLAGAALALRQHILALIFGRVEPAVMQSALVYFLLTAAAYPFIGVYNAGAALFRAMGNSKVSMYCTFIVNLINISVNAVLIYGFHMGAAGAGVGTLVSRIAAAAIIMALLGHSGQGGQGVQVRGVWPVRFAPAMAKSILAIGVPNGLENGMFQVGKLLVLNLITSFGTSAVAANAIANSIGGVVNVPGMAMGLGIITVVGRCMGAGEIRQAQHYTRCLVGASYACMAAMGAALLVWAGPLVALFGLSAEAGRMAVDILRMCALGDMLIWPLAFTLPNSLRAAGDAFYTMAVSQASMFACRVALSYVLACSWGLGLGLMGVWLAMVADWAVRAVFFVGRYRRGRWKTIQVIR